MLFDLREKVSSRMGKKRYIHTLGVEKTAEELGMLFLPDKVMELRAAALLHDVAKEITEVFKNSLFDEIADSLSDEDLCVTEAYHSFLAPVIIKRDFSEFASHNILSAVYNHTLGSPDMDLFSIIIFISDYIEPNREYEHCKHVRDYLMSNISNTFSDSENFRTLILSCIMVIEFTENFLAKQNKKIHSRSLITKNRLLSLI